jgi:hypothetical protein|tara:strand:+ start:629 stop:871 length:243 start_codon:yes stop_codon:yes gene_type:complete
MKINNSIYNHRAIRDGINAGTHVLRVTGSQKTGFRLGGEKNGCVHLFGQTYKKQTEAVAYGEGKFGKTAKKVVQTKAVAA